MKKKTKNKKKEKISLKEEQLPKDLGPNFDINKDLVFSNISELIAKYIFEKIMTNVLIEINLKNTYSLMGLQCSNFIFKEINSLLSLAYLCHEKENTFLPIIEFNDNYLREEADWDECNISQPISPELDRWKIHRINLKKHKNIPHNVVPKLNEKKKSKGTIRLIKSKIDMGDINKNLKKSTTKTYEYIDVIEKAKMKREALRFFDSFPCFPIDEKEFKQEINLTKEEEEQCQAYREEAILKEEIKKKEQ